MCLVAFNHVMTLGQNTSFYQRAQSIFGGLRSWNLGWFIWVFICLFYIFDNLPVCVTNGIHLQFQFFVLFPQPPYFFSSILHDLVENLNRLTTRSEDGFWILISIHFDY